MSENITTRYFIRVKDILKDGRPLPLNFMTHIVCKGFHTTFGNPVYESKSYSDGKWTVDRISFLKLLNQVDEGIFEEVDEEEFKRSHIDLLVRERKALLDSAEFVMSSKRDIPLNCEEAW